MKKKSALFFIFTVLSIPLLHGAILQEEKASEATTTVQDQAPVITPDMTVAATVAQSWLKQVDSGHYDQSWDQQAKQAQDVINKEEWRQLLEAIRAPLGSVTKRELLDQKTAKDPKGLIAGDYMVLFYKTDFQNKASSYELITMQKEGGSDWHVLTYQIQ